MSAAHSIFIDFDGTITENDVGYEMFKRFTSAATEPLVQRYRVGEINSFQCLSGECDIWNTCAPAADEVDRYLRTQPLREGFREFIGYLNSIEIDPVVLSEGFDFYIDRFLSHHGLSHLKKITNIAAYADGRLAPAFPYFEAGCGSCSNCKGYHINRMRPSRSCAVFIGDGHSDMHASLAADIVFARSFLGEIMAEAGAAFVPYDNFHDIRRHLGRIIAEDVFSYGERVVFKYLSPRHYDAFRQLWECGDVMKHVGYPNGLGWNGERFAEHLAALQNREDVITLAVEDRTGAFIGEALISFPDSDGRCHHDLKLHPKFRGQDLGFEAWRIILDRAAARWPHASAEVIPSVENEGAIGLYLKLGFEFEGDVETWTPPTEAAGAIPVRFRKMVRGRN